MGTMTSTGMAPARVALWGLGRRYENAVGRLLAMRELGQVELVGATAATLPPYGTLDGIPVLSREELAELDFDLLVLMVARPDDLMREVVGQWGVPREKVATSELLCLPHLDLREYVRLRTHPVSIVSSSLWGGAAYSSLQLECASPFRGTLVWDDDFLRLVADLPGHLSQPLEFDCARLSDSGEEYPVMRLGDVRIQMPKDDPSKVDVALESWNRRLARFAWDNVLLVMTTTSPRSEEAFEELPVPWRKLCLVPYESDLPHTVTLSLPPDERHFLSYASRTAQLRGGNGALDLVHVLAGRG